MRITRRQAVIGTLFVGAAAILTQCGDDPYPDIAIAFNTHGHGSAARHMDISQARASAMRLCSSTYGSGCNIRHIFEGSSQFCVSYGVFTAAPNMIVTTTAISHPKNGDRNEAYEQCNENDDNVCRRGDFARLCNH